MLLSKKLVLATVVLVGIVQTAIAGDQLFQVKDFHKIKDVSAPALSPDGEKVVYSVGANNLKIDASTSDVWLVPYKGGKPENITKTKEKSEWDPRFSPDGRHIVFLGEGKDDSGTQLFLMKADGGKVKQISNVDGGIVEYGWAPDSKRIVFTAFVGGGKANEAGTPAPVVIDRFQFKEDWVGYLAGGRRHLHVLDIEKKNATQITFGEQDHWLPSWSPDGKWIAYVTKDRGDADRNMDSDVFIMAPEKDGEQKRISTFKGTDVDPYWMSPPQWSPDSKKLVWLASGESKWIYYAPWQMMIGDIETGEVRALAHIDRCFYIPKWSKDGSVVYALVELDRSTLVAKIDATTGDISYLTEGDKFALGFDVAGDGHVVVQQSDDNMPFELFAVDGDDRELTSHNAWLKDYHLAKTEKFEFKSDGHDIGGLIVYPPDYDKTKAYPAIFRLHGGPVYQFSHEFMYDWQIYAAQGYIVVGINPRGSSGKGFEFSRAIYADWGNVDSRDILAGANYLAEKGIVDRERLGVGGWSYGGMLTNYVIATDTLFKAAVSGAGTANMLGTYGHDQYSREYELEIGTPWKNFEAYKRVSFPFLNADRIKTPTLYQCSELDFNVPCLGSEQMYQALRSTGIDTRFVLYPGQHHGIVVPSYLEDRMNRNLDWYGSYLKPGE
ncbi:S9 family peptidase [Emcibacter sp.]|uniref:S9 family peptidase n=1 Tax=Emcibacter sp. TaxID=1979954 RepID=UPI002AA7D348|nr:S9 family peptidase [Emcibacter sp.]